MSDNESVSMDLCVLRNRVILNIQDRDSHFALLGHLMRLRKDTEDKDKDTFRKKITQEYETLRESTANRFIISEDEWEIWRQDEQALLDNPDTFSEGQEGMAKLLWLKYSQFKYFEDAKVFCKFILQFPENSISFAPKLFSNLVQDFKYNYLHGYKVWEMCLEYPNAWITVQPDNPTIWNEELYEKFEKVVKSSGIDHPEHRLEPARAELKRLKGLEPLMERWEVRKISEKDDPEFWIRAIDFYASKPNFKITQMFLQAVRDRTGPAWEAVWLHALPFLKKEKSDSARFLFLKYFPGKVEAFEFYLHIGSHATIARDRLELLKLSPCPEIVNSSEGKDMILGLLNGIFRIPVDEEAAVELALKKIISLALEADDVFHTLEKFIIQLCFVRFGKFGSYMAEEFLEKVLKSEKAKHQVETWLLAYQFNNDVGSNYDKKRKLFEDAAKMISELDWPERLLDEWKRFEYMEGNDISIARFHRSQRWCLKQLEKRDAESTEVVTHETTEELLVHGKRAQEEQSNDQPSKKPRISDRATRDREHLTVSVKGIPASASEKTIARFFKGYGTTKEIRLIPELREALVEFSEESEVLAALTRDQKKIDNELVSVKRFIDSTIWVTNFPPEFTETEIRQIFAKFGTITSCRFPSLKANMRRRFCYVEFDSAEAASEAASEMNDKNLESRDGRTYTLVAKVSNPGRRSARSGAVEEGRELFVRGLDFKKVKKDTVERIFERFGVIERVNLPLSSKGREAHREHDGFGFVTFVSADDATKALELDGSILEGRIIQVSTAQPKGKKVVVVENKAEKTETHSRTEILAKSLELQNFPDTTNAESLATLLGEFGPLAKLVVQSDRGTAVAEFENQEDAAKAEIALNGKHMAGSILKVRSRLEPAKPRTALRPAAGLFVPRGAMLRSKPVASSTTSVGTNGDSSQLAEKTQAKSNDDFRKMFLKK
ncbi:unnamed protein product [Kuraishia capsulata CBS 1993]|uniref:RRM domain-containing protein n=1 Tax=Kuraishia capsulata CBS 1993 TaxID=1382522 RepID=W6MQW7_9ASCO|nr:uncharacterized protein KUCA_T00005116001 [Kuraishia capsulata CBS 1993]CDK29129.1 unnamed protein product [Kuraishia capsulata CBS 1993]